MVYKFDPFEQPDPLIDESLEMLKRFQLSDIEIRNRELRVKMFEVHLLSKNLSIFETTPHQVQGYLYGLIARSASIICLRAHWTALHGYFEFLIDRGYFLKNPVTEKTWPTWGADDSGPNKNNRPLKNLREAKRSLTPKQWAAIKKPPRGR